MRITTVLDDLAKQPADDEVLLDHLQREKARFKVQSVAGETLEVFIERGKTLRPDMVLLSDCGRRFRVLAEAEAIVSAVAPDWASFSRACYHLGNRHVRIQLGERCLKMTPDHVLEAMLGSFGLDVQHVTEPFVPEPGAYQHGHHSH